MAQILQPYRVPFAYNDLGEGENLQDVFHALQNLSETVEDIFNRIDKRISDEKKRVTQIKSRVSTCQNKVGLVRGSNKATTVFSTSKFPAPKTLPSYPTLFSQLTEVYDNKIVVETQTEDLFCCSILSVNAVKFH